MTSTHALRATPWRARIVDALARRRGALLVFTLACAVYGIEGIAWPLLVGRDGPTYILYYLDIHSSRPIYPELMLFRTPGAPLFFGPLLQIGGPVLVEVALGLGYAASIVAYTTVAKGFGRWCGIATAAALLLYPPYVALFHQISSDSVFALALALWVLGAVRVARTPSLFRFLLLGAGVAILVLVRPDAQLFVLGLLIPLFLPRPWRVRAMWAAAYAGAAVLLLVAWAGYNGARYNDFTVARGGPANLPAYRVFVLDRLVSPNNGPASRAFADVVRRELLSKWPYRQEGVTVSAFFKNMNFNYWNDLVVLSDEHWGWGSDYSELRTVALEAVRRHPKLYVGTVLDALRFMFQASYSQAAPVAANQARAARSASDSPASKYPPYRLWWVQTNPDNRIVFTAKGWHWRYPSDAAHANRLATRTESLMRDIPDRSGSRGFASFLNTFARVYPRMALWLIVGFLALLIRRPRRVAPVVVIACLGLATLVVVEAGLPTVLEYRIPFDPVFIVASIVSVGAAGGTRLTQALVDRFRRFVPRRSTRAASRSRPLSRRAGRDALEFLCG